MKASATRAASGLVPALLCAYLFAALPVAAQEPGVDTVVARVNGTDITLGHMIVLRQSLPEEYQSLPDDVLFKGMLDQLVQQAALDQSLPETDNRRLLLQMENDRRTYRSRDALAAAVQGAVTDESLQAAYDARFKDAVPATEYNAAHILVATEEEARAVKAELDAGGDFATLAAAKSSDTGSAVNGGDLGWFGLGMMVKPFEDAVIAATAGQVTEPVKSDFGWHLILVKETRPVAQPALEDLRGELAAEIEAKIVDDLIAKLTAAAKVERPGDALDPALMRKDELVGE
jgi:peptidyl-prolyl cis-trans isomerase C